MEQKKRLPPLFFVFAALSVAWTVFIFCRSAQPAVSSTEESGRLLRFLQQFFPFLTVKLVRKAAHLTEFFLLGTFVICTLRAANFPALWLTLPIGAAVAVTDELIQLTQEGRSCEVRDMCIDTAGVMLATLFFALIFILHDRRKKTG